MPHITFSENPEFTQEELLSLYAAVRWEAYTQDSNRLLQAIQRSAFVVAARHDERDLVGLVRVITDDTTICYVQDILVRPECQGEGLGQALLARVKDRFAHVRQMVLLTDDEPTQRDFYERSGFTEASAFQPGPLRAFVRLQR